MDGYSGVFAFGTSYIENAIEGKHEFENLVEAYPEEPGPVRTVLDILIKVPS